MPAGAFRRKSLACPLSHSICIQGEIMTYRKLIGKVQKGFTLVEVIVVAVIVAILAGVSIPLYLGYINGTRENAAANAAGSTASFSAACVNRGGVINLVDATGLTGQADGSVAVTCNDGIATGPLIASLVVPTDINVALSGTNAVVGKHIKGGAPSPPFTFQTAAPTK